MRPSSECMVQEREAAEAAAEERERQVAQLSEQVQEMQASIQVRRHSMKAHASDDSEPIPQCWCVCYTCQPSRRRRRSSAGQRWQRGKRSWPRSRYAVMSHDTVRPTAGCRHGGKETEGGV